MTISSEYSPDRYLGNGVTTEFAYGFKIVDEDHLVVQIADADDTAYTLTKGTHFTVDGVGEESGGTVTILDIRSVTGESVVETVPTDWSITLRLGIPFKQLTDFHNLGAFYPETHEDAFDLAVQLIQQVNELADRAYKASATSGETGDDLDADFEAIVADCQSAQAAALAAQAAAEAAQANAETAETNAETAETNAETAETNAETAANVAIAARDAVVISVHEETASLAQDTIDVTASGFILDTNKNNIQVYVDGERQLTSSWTRTSDTVITLGSALSGGEELEVYSATPGAGGSVDIAAHEAAYNHTKIATSVQTDDTDVSGNSWVVDEDDMASDLATKVPTQQSVKAYVDAAGGGGSDYPSDTLDKTDDYTIVTDDLGKRIRLTAATAADKTFTLPSVGSGEDNGLVVLVNDSAYLLTVQPSDSDTVWQSVGGNPGIELLPGATATLCYDHTATQWDLIHGVGGQVRVEGTRLYLTADKASLISTGNDQTALDSTYRHQFRAAGTAALTHSGVFGRGAMVFNGADGYFVNATASETYASDYDVFGSTSGDVTISLWAKCDDAAGSTEMLMSHYEDATNKWSIYRASDGSLALLLANATSATDINISGGALAQSTWHHVALCKLGAETGIYIDGSQVAYDASFTADTFTGSLFIGQDGSGSDWFDGRMDDIAIVYGNVFGAAPNSTPDDSFTAPPRALNLVYGG